ncbi:AGE family epimerase/isomerase [Aquimarina latercula]|uniref:AGE family epimerase/isomerase n=1 Tax=Aquimarina latercula TaxID=987 RepID=UPI0004176677|nr:AGE family epimerase/isomerase [Aquimarina latercula]
MDKKKYLKKSLENELENILHYWKTNAVDYDNGGFIGHIDYPNLKRTENNKGIILNARILWTFSAASNFYKDRRYIDLCRRSYNYLVNFFRDIKNGGVFWELDYKGNVVNRRKQVYAQSFVIYALSEYYVLTQNEFAKNWAIEIFDFIESKAYDSVNEGYLEAFNDDWSVVKDMRLSEKDVNEPKTMNTHLHLLEAYTILYKIYNSPKLKKALKALIDLFLNKFLSETGHLHLFFNEKWDLKSSIYSYGHDIETAWLLMEAANVIGDSSLRDKVNQRAQHIADIFIDEAIDSDGGVANEINWKTGEIDHDRHWWQQAEAIVGLYKMYQLTSDEKYINAALSIWEFIKNNIIDHKNGEWFWLVDKDGNFNDKNEKVGMWKCPYHNSRVCIQVNL